MLGDDLERLVEVVDILDKGKLEPARLTEGAVARNDGTILYAADQGRLAL